MQISVRSQTAAQTTLSWQPVAGAARYRILWSDRPGETVRFKTAGESGESLFTFCRSTHIPYYIKVQALAENGAMLEESTPVQTPVGRVLQQQLEALSRGLVAVTANTGVFISWRLFKSEVTGHNATGLTGTDFVLYKNGVRLATVTDSTNYLDAQGTSGDTYAVAPLVNGVEGPACRGVKPWQKGYYELPLQKPADGVTPAGEPFAYHANDMSVGDIDNDGEYEYFVKWDTMCRSRATPGGALSTAISWTARWSGGWTWGRTSAPERTTPSLWCTTSTGTAGPRWLSRPRPAP